MDSELTHLGNTKNSPHGKEGLECFPSPFDGDQLLQFEVTEFTTNCPKTGQPDFARFVIEMVPDEKCVESKSLKLYFWHFRDRAAFHEAVTNQVASDLFDVVAPKWIRVTGHFNIRGGIVETVECSHGKLPEKYSSR